MGGRAPLANVSAWGADCGVVAAPNNQRRQPEGKLVCNAQDLFNVANCTIVSVGSQNDFRFEEHIFATTNCRVEVFDCTGSQLGWQVPVQLRSRVRLHYVCLGAPEWRYAKDGGGVSRLTPAPKTRYRTATYEALLERIGLRSAPTFLKVDCEGCEVDLFRDLIDAKQTELLPDQIAVEMHYPYDPRPEDTYSPRFTDVEAKWPFAALAHAMYTSAGFTVVGSLPGAPYGYSSCCEELLMPSTGCVSRPPKLVLSSS